MPNRPYPFEPFLAMTPYEAGKLFSVMADHMPHHSGGAVSTRRAGSPPPPEPHAVDVHSLARIGAYSLWELVDQSKLSPASQAFIQQCDAACSRYAELVGEALQWWKEHVGDDGIAHTRDVTGAFRARYPGLEWKRGNQHDWTGFFAVLKWYSGQSFDLISHYDDYHRLKRAAQDVPAAVQTEIYILDDQLRELADMLENGRCPLLEEDFIPLIFPENAPLLLPNTNRMLMALYCLHQTALGLNDSRHHHPSLIPSLKLYSYEGVDAVERLKTMDELIRNGSGEEDFRATLNPALAEGAITGNGFAFHKERGLKKFTTLPHHREAGIDLHDLFIRKAEGYGHVGEWLDWLLLGTALDEHANLPDFLKPLHAYMESVRQPDGQEARYE
ncbi:hypothetical protein GC177_02830 [bacterium]|nr:hypothetical protein [bacterium]